MTYKCEGCEKTFEGTAKEAFEAGWDTPERFMSHCTCDTCPISVTLWWQLMIEKRTELTPEEGALLLSYNQLYAAANGSLDIPPRSG
jgi:hypothetical protein